MMHSRARLKARRELNARLAAIDAANRCGLCRRAIEPGAPRIVRMGESRPYCSIECADDAEEREWQRMARQLR